MFSFFPSVFLSVFLQKRTSQSPLEVCYLLSASLDRREKIFLFYCDISILKSQDKYFSLWVHGISGRRSADYSIQFNTAPNLQRMITSLPLPSTYIAC